LCIKFKLFDSTVEFSENTANQQITTPIAEEQLNGKRVEKRSGKSSKSIAQFDNNLLKPKMNFTFERFCRNQ